MIERFAETEAAELVRSYGKSAASSVATQTVRMLESRGHTEAARHWQNVVSSVSTTSGTA